MIRNHRSLDYNWNFDTNSGLFLRWGRTMNDDPQFSPVGPEILDLEISTICHGPGVPCSFCYKGNSPTGEYMTHSRFIEILNKMPDNLTQIAFGIGDIDSNTDLEKILTTTRNRGIVPNITINGYRMSARSFDMLVSLCGSIAVSHYDDNTCFDTVFELTDRGALQVNIHQVFHDSTIDDCLNLIKKIKIEPRLHSLNALLFLMLKQKGRARYQPTIQNLDKFNQLCDEAFRCDVKIGFDSCSAPAVICSFNDSDQLELVKDSIEPCEAFMFSSYANVRGSFYPCSFCEGEPGWEFGLPILPDTDFIKDIWLNDRMISWRNRLLNSSAECNCSMRKMCRSCIMFDITPCKTMSMNLPIDIRAKSQEDVVPTVQAVTKQQ